MSVGDWPVADVIACKREARFSITFCRLPTTSVSLSSSAITLVWVGDNGGGLRECRRKRIPPRIL
jgi:hypothetical protein